jgi:replicative DNA helicase
MNGDPYTVNSNHVLSFKSSYSRQLGRIINVPVADFVAGDANFRRYLKGWKTAVDFSARVVSIPPYVLGLWLGDGRKDGPRFCKPDQEIETALRQFAESNELSYSRKGDVHTVGRKKGCRGYPKNHFLESLRGYGLIDNKHIPEDYMLNSRENRLELLAGLLDTDGHLHCNGFEISQKSAEVSQSIVRLARSLGFRVSWTRGPKTCVNNGVVGIYTRILICGDTDLIPTRIERKKASPRRQVKDPLKCGVTVRPAGVGEYFGFEVDGDHLFLLGDFTVTHNSALAKALGFEVDCTTLAMDMGKMFQGIVGSSEHAMRSSLKQADAMEPCILFVDRFCPVAA